MKHLRFHFVSLLLVVLTLAACDVHQWPELHPDNPDVPNYPDVPNNPDVPNGPDDPIDPDIPKMTIPMRLEYETDFYLWEHKYDPLLGKVEEENPSLSLFPDYPGTSDKYDNTQPSGILQVYAKVYSASTSQCVSVQNYTFNIDGTYDTDFELEIPNSGIYDIVVWTHIAEDEAAVPFYNPANFNQVHIITDNYKGNTDYRDGYRGKIRIDAATEINGRYIVLMNRPMGKFELITTDLSEFLDRETEARRLYTRARPEDYRVVISFPMYYPASYSAIDDRLENSYTGMSFETQMTVTGDSEASLGFEYVMLNNISDGAVQTQVNVYRLDGTRVAGSSMFTIPMRRDHHTLLRGAFLSTEGNGGVGIDPGFNGDHNITW